MNTNSLIPRHIGPNDTETQEMLKLLGFKTLDELSDKCVPESIQFKGSLGIGKALNEKEALEKLKEYAKQNMVFKNYIGMGYSACITPSVLQRNILENPGWYTQYTPYQPEISQGRLEALLNFQTMVSDLTGFPIANASLLDEGTAAAEAMALAKSIKGKTRNTFFVSELCHPQTIEVVKTRAEPLGIKVHVGSLDDLSLLDDTFGYLLQYPCTDGTLIDYSKFISDLKNKDIFVTMACDILALSMLKAPGELGADVAVGTTQRFGLGLFYGGPHAAYFSTKEEYKRLIPGRLVGVSKDAKGKLAYRLALQTREQHIRRDKATSNICTAQVLLAVAASMYAVYHGPKGIREIANKVHKLTALLQKQIHSLGLKTSTHFFDGLKIEVSSSDAILKNALSKKINLRKLDDKNIYIQLDETTTEKDVEELIEVLTSKKVSINLVEEFISGIPASLTRESSFLTHPNFNSYHSETDFLRYVTKLQRKDLSLNYSMIPLGSCTMKLNATSEMLPISWPEFANIHPFAPLEQTKGYQLLFKDLEDWLSKITGFDAVSLQPNAGSQGEYAGLLVIRAFHLANGDTNRNICLIPSSAHGTNPASAVMAGMKVVAVKCNEQGDIDIEDLKKKALENKDQLAALMITYPSTHGVFESHVREITSVIHEYGGQVYLDGANMNAQVGLCRPGDYGADVCHLNLHKTFAIPHGGGGPGVGPIGVKKHLAAFLPGNNEMKIGSSQSIGAISAAPWGSSIILNISWAYIAMMGDEGLKLASQVSILNANYVAKRLEKFYPILFKDKNSLVAHECIVDTRILKKMAGIEVVDIAKRLMDYGFHSPTMSWPVIGTLMVEPTESESKRELDRFCDAMMGIYSEALSIQEGRFDKENNPLKMAPHTAEVLVADQWDYPYSRELAAYPMPWLRDNKFWPSISRIDDAYGDKNLVCTCPSMDEY